MQERSKIFLFPLMTGYLQYQRYPVIKTNFIQNSTISTYDSSNPDELLSNGLRYLYGYGFRVDRSSDVLPLCEDGGAKKEAGEGRKQLSIKKT